MCARSVSGNVGAGWAGSSRGELKQGDSNSALQPAAL